MQSAFTFFEMMNLNSKPKPNRGIRFTERDLDVLEFILEMKFSQIEDIHFKFFKQTKSGQESNSLRFARERVAILIKSEFLKAEKFVCARTLYTITQRGYFFLKNSRQSKGYCRPLFEVDRRTYDHDQQVTSLRLNFEKHKNVTHWISERQITEIEELRSILPSEFRPDGIYTDSSGKRYALELEIARKSKERYQQKVKKYIQVITEGKIDAFEGVHYVCAKDNVLDLIRGYAQIYAPLFKFERLEAVFSSERVVGIPSSEHTVGGLLRGPL